MRVAVVVGHCEGSKGAWNPRHNVAEYDFNDVLANQIATRVFPSGIECEVVHRTLKGGLRGLVRRLNWFVQPDLIVSLHANAHSNQTANGSEVLHWHRSKKSGHIAQIFERTFTELLSTRDRTGPTTAKGVSEEDRGGYILRYTRAWAVLCEPFFISNDDELKRAQAAINDHSFAEAYAKAIISSVIYLGK